MEPSEAKEPFYWQLTAYAGATYLVGQDDGRRFLKLEERSPLMTYRFKPDQPGLAEFAIDESRKLQVAIANLRPKGSSVQGDCVTNVGWLWEGATNSGGCEWFNPHRSFLEDRHILRDAGGQQVWLKVVDARIIWPKGAQADEELAVPAAPQPREKSWQTPKPLSIAEFEAEEWMDQELQLRGSWRVDEHPVPSFVKVLPDKR